ncbi:MAG: methylated-DNA--[protein]-cysteine S-methyltransferase [Candidatus Hydrothermarchaeaceae archaeon]
MELSYYGICIKIALDDEKVKEVSLSEEKIARSVSYKELLEYRLNCSGLTAFECAVFEKTREIPEGKVASYRDVARRVGKPNSARAVGAALAKNPFLIIVPCHRVVMSDMSIGGFSKGKLLKRRLLEREGIEFERGRVKEGFIFKW